MWFLAWPLLSPFSHAPLLSLGGQGLVTKGQEGGHVVNVARGLGREGGMS